MRLSPALFPILLAVLTGGAAAQLGQGGTGGVAAGAELSGPAPGGGNVVFLTLDGVRWKERFYDQPDARLLRGTRHPPRSFFSGYLEVEEDVELEALTPALGTLKRYPDAVTYGLSIYHWRRMSVDNRAVKSLPAYMNMMAGSPQGCGSNRCDRIDTETFLERLVKREGFAKHEVAAFASWFKLERALESRESTVTVNVSRRAFADPVAPAHQPVEPVEDLATLNRRQAEDKPRWDERFKWWTGARKDRYTFRQGLRYLQLHRPRFLFLGLVDADEWGHANEYQRYYYTLRQYDRWIAELLRVLEKMGEYGARTTVLIGTDHGRGNGEKWTDHGGLDPARAVWLWARGPSVTAAAEQGRGGAMVYRHTDIRGTVEALLGVEPHACESCWPLHEVLGLSLPARGDARER